MNNTSSKPGPKLTKTEREAVKARVAHLDRLGWNQFQIARDVGVSQPMVGQYLKRIREDYKKQQFGSRDELLAKQMESLAWTKKEVSEAWELSKQDREKHVSETTMTEAGTTQKEKDEREGRLPASEYQRLYLEALEKENKLLGLIPEQQKPGAEVNVNVGVNVNIWDALCGAVEAPPLEDEVEMKLLEALEPPRESLSESINAGCGQQDA